MPQDRLTQRRFPRRFWRFRGWWDRSIAWNVGRWRWKFQRWYDRKMDDPYGSDDRIVGFVVVALCIGMVLVLIAGLR